MKRMLALTLAVALAAALTIGAAAEGYPGAKYFDEYYEHIAPDNAGWVRVKTETAIRVKPDGGARVMERAGAGAEYEYLDRTQYDAGGVAWYSVYCYGYVGWISSEHCSLKWPTFY
ncbi:MAG: hypothetical protein IJJ45_00480 [Clostridia bacterium]|nr:hypothetical protein [Clostridia bacterium]